VIMLLDAARLSMKQQKPNAVEQALDELGKNNLKVTGHQIDWKPPANLERFVEVSIRASLESLEDLVRTGKLTVDANGDVHVK
jgi:hypothetical protein